MLTNLQLQHFLRSWILILLQLHNLGGNSSTRLLHPFLFTTVTSMFLFPNPSVFAAPLRGWGGPDFSPREQYIISLLFIPCCWFRPTFHLGLIVPSKILQIPKKTHILTNHNSFQVSNDSQEISDSFIWVIAGLSYIYPGVPAF